MSILLSWWSFVSKVELFLILAVLVAQFGGIKKLVEMKKFGAALLAARTCLGLYAILWFQVVMDLAIARSSLSIIGVIFWPLCAYAQFKALKNMPRPSRS